MSKIVIGESDGKSLRLDVDLLLTSRLLIQANSGGGKSWLLRRLAEQFYGHVQTIIIDPEGEFYTLREKFGYVLVGEGGETPCDVRSAAMLAERFLELKASAVCDLYEAFRSRPMDRRQWVRAFLNALLDAPRSMWHPLIVIVDEAHKFCPQETPKAGNQTDREIIGGCKDAMIGLSTTGRKRGFCAIWATQRLAKVDKDASAELFNRMVGMTIEDVDVDRAADLMSVSKDQKQEFRQSLRTLVPGQFYSFGRAISNERRLVMVGDVITHHPQTGIAAKHETAPPTPEDVKKFLPQLADLPKEVEEKAKNIAALQQENRELKKALKQRPTETKQVIEEKIVEVPVLQPEQIAELQDAVEEVKEVAAIIGNALAAVRKAPQVSVNRPQPSLPALRPQVMRKPQASQPSNGDADLTATQIRVLSRLVELTECTHTESVRKEQLAAWAEYSPNSGGFNNYLGGLRTAGMIHYPQPGMVAITEEGQRHAAPEDVPASSNEMLARAKRVLGGSEAKLLEILHDTRETVSKIELAEAAGFSPNSGGFNNYLGHMRTLGFVEYPQPGQVKCADWLYLNGDAA